VSLGKKNTSGLLQ